MKKNRMQKLFIEVEKGVKLETCAFLGENGEDDKCFPYG